VLARTSPGIRFNEHLDAEDGPLVFAHACKMGRTSRGRRPHRHGRWL
jgi:hypothetical protein